MRIYVLDMELVGMLKSANDIYEKVPNDEIVFGFSKIHNFDPLPVLIMGATIRNYRMQYPDIPFRIHGYEERSYAGTVGSLGYIPESVGIRRMPGEANSSKNYIPVTLVRVNELQQDKIPHGNHVVADNLIEEEVGRLAHIVDRGNRELHELLTHLIKEILRNTPKHAGTNNMWVCGQYWSFFELAEIAIADEGMGIYNSITQSHACEEYITDNKKTLQQVLKASISGTFIPSRKQRSSNERANSGFGLYMVNEVYKHLSGSFCTISCGNYILIDSYGIKYGEINFKGTATRMGVPSKKILNVQTIIPQTATQGELEVKTIRNIFKNASMPSRGLMSELNTE